MMDTEAVTEATESSAPAFDVQSASDKIAEAMFPPNLQLEKDEDTEGPVAEAEASAPVEEAYAEPVPLALEVPKSWPETMHQHWPKVPKEVQDYWQLREKQMMEGLDQYKGVAAYGKSVQDVLAPYKPLLESKGLDAPRAVADLMQAYTAMTQGTQEQRRMAYEQVGKNLGITSVSTESATPVDPQVKALQDQFNQIQYTLTSQQTAALEAAKEKAGREVEAFASDPKNVYFNEVADDILIHLKAGHDLPTAYKLAVRGNEVTFHKEIARISTETEAKLKENARLDALPKQKAKSVNIGGRETQRAPTEPLGSMDDTLKSTLRDLRARVVH
jgi:hypothetical protein